MKYYKCIGFSFLLKIQLIFFLLIVKVLQEDQVKCEMVVVFTCLDGLDIRRTKKKRTKNFLIMGTEEEK